MRTVKLDASSREDLLAKLLRRDPNNYREYEETVNEIVTRVRTEGDAALFFYTEKFDKAVITAQTVKVTQEEIDEALEKTDPGLIGVMRRAMENIRVFHEKQKQDSWIDAGQDGILLGQKVTPLDSAGIYVPGGKAAYP
ncbi:MAG: histidinol dehydrogenase, partial [Parasporobacterium sp.]|nr:histidinol dehydrogenase [Parasporobacterium sp.]